MVMLPPSNLVPNQEPYVECPMCHSSAWSIYIHRVSCCRCGLSYQTPNISFLQTTLIPNSVPTQEIIKALEILDGPEK